MSDTAQLNGIHSIVQIMDKYHQYVKDEIKCLVSIEEKFAFRFEEEKKKLPYSINILDEIHANENAHSRILLKILEFKKGTDYPILSIFLTKFFPEISKLDLGKSILTTEKSRIDLRVRHECFSLIVENKIHGAVDQEKQIERYIEIERECRKKETEIFILYLTLDGGSPTETSISKIRRKEFGRRYKEINYKDDIYPLLKNEVMTYVNQIVEIDSTTNLSSALIQYIDFLEGRFNCREGEKNMNEKMVSFLKEEFGLNKNDLSPIEKLKIIRKKNEFLTEMLGYLPELKMQFFLDLLPNCKDKIFALKIDGIENIPPLGKPFGEKDSSIEFFPLGWNERFHIALQFDQDYSFFFVGIKDTEKKTFNELSQDSNYIKISEYLPSDELQNEHWLFSKFISYKQNDVIDFFSDSDYLEVIENEIRKITSNVSVFELLKA